MSRRLTFARINMDDALTQFIRTSYGWGQHQKVSFVQKLQFYDAFHKIDPEIFIKYTQKRIELTNSDIVIPDVRYINEMKALQEMGFIICRVTTTVKRTRTDLFTKHANEGSVAVAMQYDKSFSTNHKANYSINWTSKSKTPMIVDTFLETIGYKLDI